MPRGRALGLRLMRARDEVVLPEREHLLFGRLRLRPLPGLRLANRCMSRDN